MRLTHIKLAGFKSFVDPVNIPIPAQLVGVVGPNGCGKSNVIDAVRWVLGESQAKQLRGETMQDVIFNGSGGRKPAGRASVELIFDNGLGKAAGQWSQYAEIAIKRVLTRNGESTYYINNLHVRRRDVTDLFLGTGLGVRAYAIIEQGMISRIIEAKPEELRVFLEEAAGISKYKERRRETGLRLHDSRENLLRVDDIRRELETQLQNLDAQASVAQQYHDLQQQLTTAQNQFWLLRKTEAQAQRERYQKDVERLGIELEAQIAQLRDMENRLEQSRAAHYAASDALHAAQGDLYSANAEVARVEQQLQHLRENRQRIENQLNSLREQLALVEKQRETSAGLLEHWRSELEKARVKVEQATQHAAQQGQGLPLAEQAFRDSQQRVGELQSSLAKAGQEGQVEETHRTHAIKTLQQLQSRRERLMLEQQGLPRPDQAGLEQKQRDLSALEMQLNQAKETLATAQQQLPAAEQAKLEAERALQAEIQQATKLEAQLHALQKLQSRIGSDDKLQAWLAKYHLVALPRLWQSLHIEPGWENALEAVLRERLNALALDSLQAAETWLQDTPPGQLTVFETAQGAAAERPMTGPPLSPLRHLVTCRGAAAESLLDDWLHAVYTVEDRAQGMQLRHELAHGAMLVSREGDIFTRHSIAFYAPQSELHGVLQRQNEIEQLSTELVQQEAQLAAHKETALQTAAHVAQCQADLVGLRNQVSETQSHHHRLQMEAVQLTQMVERATQRSEQIGHELAEIGEQIEGETEQQLTSESRLEEIQATLDELKEHFEAGKQARAQAENTLSEQRQAAQSAEREAQSALFHEKDCQNKISELNNNIQTLNENYSAAKVRLEQAHSEQLELDEAPIQQALQLALTSRQSHEQSLMQARDALEGVSQALKQLEQERMITEQKLDPLRQRAEEARLKEQEARLNETQFAEQLQAAAADEVALLASLDKNAKPNLLQTAMVGLNEAILALGAVNLAALDELQTGRERKAYLDAQADDLNQAIETLESAIRRIDRETRERLQSTFDTVNRSMSELFPTLFGGGEAYLVLTGEEILDAGVQVVAQPPGKKNSSIHLLSGGEKALTALSLVFSLFKLNPAPFCLLDEVDAPLDDSNTERFCELVKKMSQETQFLFISHNKITMEMAQRLIGVTMQESGISRVVAVDIEEAMRMQETVTI